MPEREVEARLRALGGLELPPSPEIAPVVRARLERETGSAFRPARTLRRSLAIAAATLLLAGGLAYAVSGEVRHQVRELLGIGGVEIERVPVLPPAQSRDLGLGQPIEPSSATRRAGFTPLTADNGLLRNPSGVYARRYDGGIAISYAYDSRPGLPALGGTATGLVVTEFESDLDPEFIKSVLIDSSVDPVRVGPTRGYWFGDGEHVLDLPVEGVREERRLSTSTLVWERNDVTLRLEAEIESERAVRLARTLR